MRVLIVRVGAMGDVLHALPAVAALKRERPQWEIGWAIEPRWRALLEDDAGERPVVDRVHEVETRQWKRSPVSLGTLRSIARLRRELRAEHYDVCVDLQGSIRSAVVGSLAGSRRLVGAAHPRETPARWLYRRTVNAQELHVVDQAAELLRGATGVAVRPGRAVLPHDAVAEATCDRVLRSLPPIGLVLLVPGAGWGAKQWPPERFGAVARTLAEAGYTPLVNAFSESDPLAAAVVRAAEGRAIAVRCSVPELIALTRRMALMIAGDTGPLHLAAALERPVVALFGPTDPARTGPFGTASRVFRHRSSVTDHRRHGSAEDGLLEISTAEVTEASLDLLRQDQATAETAW